MARLPVGDLGGGSAKADSTQSSLLSEVPAQWGQEAGYLQGDWAGKKMY